MSFFYICEDIGPGDRADSSEISVLVVSGELDYSASPHLKERILDRMKAGRLRLVIDLSAVTFIDSMAIGVLVGCATRLREMNGSLRVVCAEENERVLRIFDIAGVASSIALHHSREEALSGFPARPAPEVRAWVTQAPAISDTDVVRPSGLAAAQRYAREAASALDDRPPASRRQPGGEIDKLA